MKKTWNKLDRKHKTLYIISLIGLAHFSLSLLAWSFTAIFLLPQHSLRPQDMYPCAISIVLFLLFFLSARLIAKQRNHAASILVITILITVFCFFYETRRCNHQMQFNRKGTFIRKYFNWPIYEQSIPN